VGTASGKPDDIPAAVSRADLDELLRMVDGLCASRDWPELVTLRDRCRDALATGRQLWPVAAHAEYRLALEAPGPFAAAVLVEGTGRFTLGPLPEVAASTHRWPDLADHVVAGPLAALTMHERVLRGDDLTGAAPAGPPVLEVPLRLEPWEPVYALAEYHAHRAEFPAPPLPELAEIRLGSAAPRVGDDGDATAALRELVGTWTRESEGRADVAAVAGDAAGAIGALGPRRVRIGILEPAAALALMAWAAASGGAHGRRPGAAAGRFGAWWAAAALAGLLDDWPIEPGRLGAAVDALRWYAWDAAEPATGWRLQIAVEDPARGRAWAIAAGDAR
jgi:hypothetical protein